jgi:hypothetical protein
MTPIVSLAILLLALLAYTLWGIYRQENVPAALSTVAATMSALVALFVSVRSQLRDDKRHAEDRARDSENRLKEQERADALRRDARKVLTALYATEIEMWLGRKELGELLSATGRAAQQMFTHKLTMNVMLYAKESMETASTSEGVPDHFQQSMAVSRHQLAIALAMPGVRAASSIPNIWTTQFKRDDVSVLGNNALHFFLGMATIWTNIGQMSKQIPAVDDAVEFIFANRSADVEQYLGHLERFLEEVKSMLQEFIGFARVGSKLLAEHPAASDTMAPLPLVDSLLTRSQRASLGIASLQEWILVERSIGLANTADQEFRQAIRDFNESEAARATRFDELKRSAVAALERLGRPQESPQTETQPPKSGDKP